MEALQERLEETKVTSNIYRIPIYEISFLQCLEGFAKGICALHYFSEGENSIEAALKLTKAPSYWENYIKLSFEERKFLKPFRLRFDKEAEKIPACENRHKTERGDYVCGPPMTDLEYDIHAINGEFGDCMCQGFWAVYSDDLRDSCPYREILENS